MKNWQEIVVFTIVALCFIITIRSIYNRLRTISKAKSKCDTCSLKCELREVANRSKANSKTEQCSH